jgi:ADP-ribose pyrophosphatase YjhB (NUDIX family)
MPDREPLSLRVIDAVEGRLRPLASPRVMRLVYQLGYLVLRPWWFLTRPKVTGIKAVVRCGDEVLLVRHTYGPRRRWDVPGGFVKRGEEGEFALRRELAEELDVHPVSAKVIARAPSRKDHKRETRITYVADVADKVVAPSVAEIAEARWFHRETLPPRTTRFARQMVARAYWDPVLLDGSEPAARDPTG